jgi:hypothetical protein
MARTFRADVVADSTAVLPDRVVVRVSPTDFCLLDASDMDRCLASWPYKDLRKWNPSSAREIHVTVKSATGNVRFTFAVDAAERLKDAIDTCIDKNVKARSAISSPSARTAGADDDDEGGYA